MTTSDKEKICRSIEVSMRDYVDLRFQMNSVALEKAEATLNARLEILNEFRGAVNDILAKSIPRSEFDIIHARVISDIVDLQEAKNIAAGKASQSSVFIAYLIAALSLLFSAVAIFH